jgi:hypothetical protein
MVSELFPRTTKFAAFPTSRVFSHTHKIAPILKGFPKIAKPASVSTNGTQYNVTRTLPGLSPRKHSVIKLSVQYLNDTTLSCYSLYMCSWNPSQLSNQVMCTTEGSQFLSLLPATLKYVATLSIT